MIKGIIALSAAVKKTTKDLLLNVMFCGLVRFFDPDHRNRLSPVHDFLEVLILVGGVFRAMLCGMAVTAR